MKNVSKFLLVVLLAGASYFFGMVVYGACTTVPGIGIICGNGDVCNDAGCLCNGSTISLGETCTNIIAPSTDGVLGTTSYGETCSDGDGCNCSSPSGNTTISYGDQCTWDISLPVLSAGSVNVVNRTATFIFNSSKAGTVSYQGSCGNGSLSTAVAGDNTTNFINLSNSTYSNCQLRVTDNLNNSSTWLNIPSFTVNYTGGGTSGGGSVGGGSSSTITEPTFLSILSQIGVTETGFINLLEIVKEEKSVVYEYTPQGVKIRIFVPKYRQYLIRKTILSLNNSLTKAINKKLLRVTDPSYMIENFENLNNDSKILVYKEIGAITHLYNEFLGVLYIVLDMKQKDYLPLAKYYLENYFKEFINFQK
ncbi:MAG: hypothetical protein PHR61_04680 [Candidatus Absconditabacteria bacterium]|nr:hypothetical protein [Candidatus Absconditabacteria bacterium]